MDVKEIGKKYEDYVVEMRRWFHENPEPSEKEFQSSQRIKEELDRIGVEWRPCGLETGILATIHGAKPGKTVLIRGDMDALEIVEETGLPFASKTEGMMHACGHDSHMAMALTAVHILNDMKDEFCGTIKIAFQPSEEVATGGIAMCAEGAMEGVDSCFAMHVWGGVPTGTYCCMPGVRFGANHHFSIDITGKGGHASMPQDGIDALVCGSAIVQSAQTLVSREYSPNEPVVVTFGEFHSGSRWNILPGTAHLEGTCRTFNDDIFRDIDGRLERIVKKVAEAYRCEASVRFFGPIPPMPNDPHVSAVASAAAEDILGADSFFEVPPTTASEDFSYFAEHAPGALMLLGIADEESCSTYANHHPKFTINESVLIKGAMIHAETAMRLAAEQ